MANTPTSGLNAAVTARAGKYLTFGLKGEIYGLEILKVQEIIGMMKVTRVPQTPGFIRGVINLRGKVIPVVDLRTKFGIESQPDTEKTCIIVVQVAGGVAGKLVMGILVDEVAEVLNINEDQMEPPPELGAAVSTDFILGIGKVGQKVIMVLDIDKVLSTGELAAASKVAKA